MHRKPNKQKNGKTSDKAPNDENWKLLKFLVDRIEANKSKSPAAETMTSPKHKKKSKRSKQIPITGNLLKRRKKPISATSRRKKISVTNMQTSFSNDALHARLHTKTKSQALYTSAINKTKFNINSPTRVSKAGQPQTSFRFKDKSQTPRVGQMSPARTSSKLISTPSLSMEHQKSHSTHLPHKYTHHLSNNHTHPDRDPPSPSSSTTPSQNTEIEQNSSNLPAATTAVTTNISAVKFSFPQEMNGETKIDTQLQNDDPLEDPVQSLVTFVRRVTEKINKEDAQQMLSDQETIRKVYDKYVDFYHRLPVHPDHLRKFSHKFKGVRITYAAAKQYLDNVKAIDSVTSPRGSVTDETKPLGAYTLRSSKARQSISTPILPGLEKSDSHDSDASDPQKKRLKITLDAEQDINDDNDRENLYAFYKLTDLELLRCIKKKIDTVCNNNQDTEDTIMNLWEREYSELEKRLHKQFLNPMHKRKQLTSSLSFNHQQLKRDTTYKSLKQMSEATDIDDQEHDAAVHLLNTYFPDDEEDIHDEMSSYEQTLLLSPPYAIHTQHSSNIVPHETLNQYADQIKPQEQHIRSVTVDHKSSKQQKPSLYRRSTTRSIRQTEALSLYDSMVMKARETKILNKKSKSPRRYKSPQLTSLQASKSLPTRDSHKAQQPTLGTIPSQDSAAGLLEADTFEDEEEEEETGKLINMIEDMHGVYHQPFQLDDDEMQLYDNDTSEPPLFDAAFRQLTTTTDPLVDEQEQEQEDGSIHDVDALSIEHHLSNSTAHTAHSTITMIPNNLLHIMDKYGDSMESWDFDIFEFMDDPALCGKGLVLCTFYIFRKVGLLDATGIAQANLWRFLEKVECGYLHNNPYHNRYHAVDVMLSTHYMFQSSVFRKHMTMWDQFGAYIAAVCHDLGHMGLNNAWYINTAGNLALLYGDESVLENYHIAETFRILNDSKNNWMLSFPSSVRRYLATVIRRTILATDLKVHGTKMIQLQNMVDTFKNLLNDQEDVQDQHELIANNLTLWRCESIANYASLDNIMLDNFPLFANRRNDEWIPDVLVKDLDIDSDENDANESEPHRARVLDVDDERIFLLEITIHACDVANPCKPIYIAKEWANRYLREAFNQGDMERNIGIPVSAGMDRFTSKLPTSQIGFITFVVKRLFLLYSELIDVANHCVEIMLKNEQFWIQEKKKMNKNNKKVVGNLVTINE